MKTWLKTALLGLTVIAAPMNAFAQTDATGTALTVGDVVNDTDNWRAVDPTNLIQFEIEDAGGNAKGTILIEMAPFSAPGHIKRFTEVVKSGDYDGTVFHRVIGDFMAQGGDVAAQTGDLEAWPDIPGEFVFKRYPLQDASDVNPAVQTIGPAGTAKQGYALGFPIHTQARFLAELKQDGSVESWIPHCKGVVSTARTNDPNSASTQFFLMRETKPHLNRLYTAWGRIVYGQDVVDNMKTGEPVRNPDVLARAVMVSDLEEGQRPQVFVKRTDTVAFTNELSGMSPTEICGLPPVPAIVAFP